MLSDRGTSFVETPKKLLCGHCFSSFSNNHESTSTHAKNDVINRLRRPQPPPAFPVSTKCPTADVRNRNAASVHLHLRNRKRIGLFFQTVVDTSMLKDDPHDQFYVQSVVVGCTLVHHLSCDAVGWLKFNLGKSACKHPLNNVHMVAEHRSNDEIFSNKWHLAPTHQNK